MPRIVVLESPYKGKNSVRGDIEYARKCRRDCFFNHGEVPIFSHLFYKLERGLNVESFLRVIDRPADATVVYTDLGIDNGMYLGIEKAMKANRPVEYRSLKDSLAKSDLEDIAS